MDGELIERARTSDADSFDELARSRIDQVYATALGILGSPADARDACHEALVAMWRGLPLLREPAAFDGWLYRITVTSGLLPVQHRGEIVIQEPIVHVANTTTLTLSTTVNGLDAGSAAAMASTVVDVRQFGQAPWTIVARTSSGLELHTLELAANSAYYMTGDYPLSAFGPFSRLDLSCGRLDLWVGYPPSGPRPLDTFPAHDCDP